MTEITKNNLSEFVLTGEFDIAASVSADDESKKAGVSVNVILRFKMDKTPVSEIISSSLKDKRINWQVKGRKTVGNLRAGQIVNLDYRGGRVMTSPMTPEQVKAAFKQQLASMTPEERKATIAGLRAQS